MSPFPSVLTTPISIVFPDGDARARFSSASALAPPRRRLLDEGTDPGGIVYLGAATPDGNCRVLGILSATADRLRFFPGQGGTLLLVVPRDGRPGRVLTPALDSLTLDVATRTARFGSRDGRGVGGILGRRPETVPGLVRWFRLIVPVLDRLEPLPGVPWRTDAVRDPSRRIRLLRGASRAVALPLPALPPRASVLFDVHVDRDPGRPLRGLDDDDGGAAAPRGIYDVPHVAGTAMLRVAWRLSAVIDEPAFAVCV
jgi:hypothetical protein